MSISPRRPFEASALAAGFAAVTRDRIGTAQRQAGVLGQMRDLILRALRLQTQTIARSHGAPAQDPRRRAGRLAEEMSSARAAE
ncbi:hypothetical protein CNY89_20270, partial [Amaricoccus sp. HAR-UPW-R2A-40]